MQDYAELKKKLEHTKRELEKEIKELEEKVPEFGNDVEGSHSDEETDETTEVGTNLGIADALRNRLANVDTALEKFAKGTYGICETCRGTIDAELLEVDPETRYCRDCKKKINRR